MEARGVAPFNVHTREFAAATLGAAAAAGIDRTHIFAWGSDLLTVDSYSEAKVGKVGARATFAGPLDDRLYFAGEAASTTSHSSLPSAYLTGQSAATSIFERLRPHLDSVG